MNRDTSAGNLPPIKGFAPYFRHFQSTIGLIIYAIAIGCFVAVVAHLFEQSFQKLSDFWRDGLSYFGFPVPIKMALGLLVTCPILYFLINKIPEKRQHNPADLITGIHINEGIIDAKSSLLTVLATIFSIGAGFSVGYYGPSVQLGASTGFLLHRFSPIKPSHYYISIGAGTAAAIAAIFHSPIGAVVFVHEVLFRFFSVRAFAVITIAAVSSYIVSNQLFNKLIFFNTATHFANSIHIYWVASLAGVLAALVSVLMIKVIMHLQKRQQKDKRSLLQQFFIAAILSALVVAFLPNVAGNHFETLQSLISGSQFSLMLLLAIFIGKLLMTIIAFGFGIPGGLFGPSLFLGAALGALVMACLTLFFPGLPDTQIIIITTMAAMVSAVIGAPMAMILIAVEMTGDFQIISVVMLAVVMANITAYQLMRGHSFFELQMKLRGFDFEMSKKQLYAEHHSIKKLISDDYLKIPNETNLRDAEKQLLEAQKEMAFVVDNDNNLLGKVNMIDIRYYLRETSEKDKALASIMTVTQTDIKTVYQATSIWQALQDIAEQKVIVLPVVDGENNPKLLGIIDNNTLINQYFSAMKAIQKQRNVTK